MTYSLGVTGRRADQQFAVSNVSVGDDAGRLGSQQLAMAQGTPILCKGPDGAQAYYTLDASRSTPGNVVLNKL